MEVAGLVFGVVGLYSTCISILDDVQAYRDADLEAGQLYAQLQADKVRFEKWGAHVGILEARLLKKHDPTLDDHDVCKVIKALLHSIAETFQANEKGISKLQLKMKRARTLESFDTESPVVQSKDKMKAPKSESKTSKLVWVFRRRGKLTAQTEIFRGLVDRLYDLVPLDHTQSLSPPQQVANAVYLDGGMSTFKKVP